MVKLHFIVRHILFIYLIKLLIIVPRLIPLDICIETLSSYHDIHTHTLIMNFYAQIMLVGTIF